MDKPATRVALITGAARGIGYHTALRLAKDGYFVAVNDVPAKSDQLDQAVRDLEAIIPTDGDKQIRALSVPGDVSKESDVEKMVNDVVSAFGRLDVMVANAGYGGPIGTIMDAKIEEWEALFSVNIRGVILCYKYAAMQMVNQGFGGRIIGASSMAGYRGNPRTGAYCASKAAVRSLTQTLALELEEHGITVNAYAPGVIETELTKTARDEEFGGVCSLVKKLYHVPDAKVAPPDVVASIVAYLVKPEAYFITGQTISVDGGIRLN